MFILFCRSHKGKFVAVTVIAASIDNIFTNRENVTDFPIIWRKSPFQWESFKGLCGVKEAILSVFEGGHVGLGWGALMISFDCGDKAAYLLVQSLPAPQSSLIRIFVKWKCVKAAQGEKSLKPCSLFIIKTNRFYILESNSELHRIIGCVRQFMTGSI